MPYSTVFTYKMKCLVCILAFMLSPMVNSYPVDVVCAPECNQNIITTAEFVNEWLNQSSRTGVHQLRNHKDTIVNVLLNSASTGVS